MADGEVKLWAVGLSREWPHVVKVAILEQFGVRARS